MNDNEAHIALNMMDGVGPVAVRELTAVLGSTPLIFEAGRASLLSAKGVGQATADAIISQRDQVDWRGEIGRAAERDIRIVTQIDKEYPASLRAIHDPPLALYLRGSFHQSDRHAVAIVGTRRPTHYGLATAERLGYELAAAGLTVVSGLAEGIDAAAHRGALQARGRTVAIIGSALDKIYPASHAELADTVSAHGALVSEFALGRMPDKTTFPMRNRIVSGMSMGVIVVEAARRSGALITVGQALQQGRAVFAVPGRIDSPASQGTHDLIRAGAQLIRCADDVLEDFQDLFRAAAGGSSHDRRPQPPLSDDEGVLLELLAGGARDVDGLIRESGLRPATVSSLLISLEMKKVIHMLPGRIVEKRTD